MTPIVLFEEAWEGNEEATVTNWFFDEGASVSEGDLIAEVMVLKAAIEVRAPASGRLTISVPVDGIVSKGTKLGGIG